MFVVLRVTTVTISIVITVVPVLSVIVLPSRRASAPAVAAFALVLALARIRALASSVASTTVVSAIFRLAVGARLLVASIGIRGRSSPLSTAALFTRPAVMVPITLF